MKASTSSKSEILLATNKMGRQSRKCCPRSLKGCLTYLFGLVILLFVIVFVIMPFVFKYSKEIQRNIIFPTWYAEKANFSDPESFGIQGVRNFYLTVNDDSADDDADGKKKENVTLGIWQILPDQVLSEFITNDNYNYEAILANETFDILLYFHGNGGIRSLPLELYAILRRSFHVLAPDYRGYGDSSKAELTEDNIVKDLTSLFKWTKNKSQSKIFIWGHSLGTGVSTHLISNLKKENYTVSGLVLETPFSSVTDVMELHPIVKVFSWLPWFEMTFLDPIRDNGFGFNSKQYILDVDCPIMILHAKDDTIIPYQLATKLYEIAVDHRNSTFQGNVTYHLFEAKGYDHMFIYLAPELPTYIRNFTEECYNFQNSSKQLNVI